MKKLGESKFKGRGKRLNVPLEAVVKVIEKLEGLWNN